MRHEKCVKAWIASIALRDQFLDCLDIVNERRVDMAQILYLQQKELHLYI